MERQNQPISVYVLGLDPLESLTPLDGILDSIHRLANPAIQVIGVADELRQSAVALSDAFDQILVVNDRGNGFIPALIAQIHKVPGFKLLLPTRASDVKELATHKQLLNEYKISYFGPSKSQILVSPEDNPSLFESLSIQRVPWIRLESSDSDSLDSLVNQFPLKMASMDRNSLRIVENADSLKIYLNRHIESSDLSILVRPVRSESNYQASSILDHHGMPVEWTMVRELNNDSGSQAWMFLDIPDPHLARAASSVAMVLNCQGPLTLGFTRADSSHKYELDYIRFLLPSWSALPASFGVNFVKTLIEMTVGEPIHDPSLKGPRGQMIVFNSFDIPVSSETWLKRVTSGGR